MGADKWLFYIVVAKIVLPPLTTFLFGWLMQSPLKKKDDLKASIVLPQDKPRL